MGCECVDNKCNSGCGNHDGKPCNTNEDCQNEKKNSFSIDEFKKITSKKYSINYTNQKGGAKSELMKSKDNILWSNKTSFNTYNDLLKKVGKPDKTCINSNGIVEYVIWQDDYDNVKTDESNRLGGLDFLKITNYHARKWHPKPANVFIIAGKYLQVPDHLLGPIKYASETINVEQLFVEKSANEEFGRTGNKGKVLVTGSCASIDISTVTVAFVEDMIRESKNKNVDIKLHEDFKDEYDRRINNYIKTNQFDPISWYKRDTFY